MRPDELPNVVFFIVDDTHHKYLGCWGGEVPSPNLDRLRRGGMRFDRAFCTSAICQPSRYSYLTGRYASTCPDPFFRERQPVDEAASVEFNVYLNADIPSQGFLFGQAGYRTGFAGKWHVGHPNSELDVPEFDTDADPDDQDVDSRLGELQSVYAEEVRRTGGYDFADGVIWGNNGNWPLKALHDHHIEWSTLAALDFLEGCEPGRPFLLHYASTCTHGPPVLDGLDRDWHYTPGGKVAPGREPLPRRELLPGRLREMGVEVNHHNASALWIDDQVGALLDKLDEMGELENTVFVFCSDHNIEPGKSTCYERGINVPLMIAGPGVEGGVVSDALVQNVDLMPTLLSLCGIEVDETVEFDGVDCTPLLRGQASKVREDMFFEVGYQRAARTERWKYVALRFPGRIVEEMQSGQREEAPNHIDRHRQPHAHIAMQHYPGYYDPDQLYDLEQDPDEQRNLAGDPRHERKLWELQDRLQDYLKELPHPYPLGREEFLESARFKELAQRTIAVGTDFIPWWP